MLHLLSLTFASVCVRLFASVCPPGPSSLSPLQISSSRSAMLSTRSLVRSLAHLLTCSLVRCTLRGRCLLADILTWTLSGATDGGDNKYQHTRHFRYTGINQEQLIKFLKIHFVLNSCCYSTVQHHTFVHPFICCYSSQYKQNYIYLFFLCFLDQIIIIVINLIWLSHLIWCKRIKWIFY